MYNDMMFEGNLFAIMPERIEHIIALRKTVKITMTEQEVQDAMNRQSTKFKDIKGDVAVIPVHGFISHKASIYSALGLESSSEQIAKWVEQAANDPSIGAIVLDVDSPGGSASGLSTTTEKIKSMRGKKPIIAVSNTLMGSAAYFLASASDEIVADPDAETGSIGTLAFHFDISKMLDDAGIKVTKFASSKFKGEGFPYEPLSEEAKEHFQEMVDSYSEVFHSAVAANRGKSISDIKQNFGQGRTLRASKAKEVGMIDRIGSLESVINRLLPKTNKSKLAATVSLLKMQSTI